MEEINRLHDMADDIGGTSWGYELASALHNIAADIGEKVDGMRHVGEYEDDVLTFVEAYGGLEEVKAHMMPEGMEWLLDVWPKWSNGEYCKFGDWWKSEKYGESKPQQLRKLSIYSPEQLREWGQDDGDHFGYEWDFVRPSDPKDRMDKAEPPAPKVLDADGVEIRVGDEVFVIATGKTHHVTVIDHIGKRFKSMEQMGDDATWLDPVCFTHRAPVLAADGRPLREGETVWHKSGLASGVVVSIDAGSLMHTVRYRDESGVEYRDAAKDLTHERPDSWERLEEDATKLSPYYYARDVMGLDTDKMPPKESRRIDMMRDLVRRAKALAERGQ